jgi:hypothetical protein
MMYQPIGWRMGHNSGGPSGSGDRQWFYVCVFPGGVQLTTPPSLLTHGARVALAECLAGRLPWDEHARAAHDAMNALEGLRDVLYPRDGSPPSAETEAPYDMIDLLCGDVASIDFVGSPWASCALLTRDHHLAGVQAIRFTAFRLFEGLADADRSFLAVAKVIGELEGDPLAAALRAHPSWSLLHEVRDRAALQLWQAASWVGSDLVTAEQAPDGTLLSVDVAEPGDGFSETMADWFASDARLQLRFLALPIEADRVISKILAAGAAPPGRYSDYQSAAFLG